MQGRTMRRAIIVSFCFIVALSTPTPSIAQSPAPQNTDKYAEKLKVFEDFVRKQMEKDKIPGLTIGFYIGDYEWSKASAMPIWKTRRRLNLNRPTAWLQLPSPSSAWRSCSWWK